MNEIKSEIVKWEQKLALLASDQLANGENLIKVQRSAQENLIKVQRNAQEKLGKFQREALQSFWLEVKLLAVSPIASNVNTILTTYLSEGHWREGVAGVHGKTVKALKLNEDLLQNVVTNSSETVDIKLCIDSNDLNKERWEMRLREVCLYLKYLLFGLRILSPSMENRQARSQVEAACSEIEKARTFMLALGEACVAQYLLIWKRTNVTRPLAPLFQLESVQLSAAKTRNVQSTNANRFKI